jgi:hypothetical protein
MTYLKSNFTVAQYTVDATGSGKSLAYAAITEVKLD